MRTTPSIDRTASDAMLPVPLPEFDESLLSLGHPSSEWLRNIFHDTFSEPFSPALQSLKTIIQVPGKSRSLN